MRWHCRPSTLHTDSLLSSKEDVQTGDMRQWSSTDSSGYSTDGSSRLRVNVTKASSFHGVTVLSRTDSSTTNTSGYYMSKTGAPSFLLLLSPVLSLGMNSYLAWLSGSVRSPLTGEIRLWLDCMWHGRSDVHELHYPILH